MPSLDPIPTTLSDHLRHLGLGHTAAELNDLIARATQKRWSPVVLLEQLAQAELAASLHHRVERRAHDARLDRFKPLADEALHTARSEAWGDVLAVLLDGTQSKADNLSGKRIQTRLRSR